MRYANSPVRFFAEILGIVGVCELLVMVAMPYLALGVGPLASGLLNIALLLGLAGPAVYWRSMAITRHVAAAARSDGGRADSSNIRLAVVMTAGTQLMGLGITAAGIWWQHNDVERTAQVRFDRGVDRVESEVKRRMELPLYGLTGARAAYASSEKVTRAEFRDLVQALDVEHQFAGVRGFSFVERVQRVDLDRYVQLVHADGMPEFQVKTSGDAPDVYVVRYVEPLDKNFPAWGFDEGQESVRRDALERAISTGSAALSGRVTLLQDEFKRSAFLYALPVFRSGTDPESPSQRLAALKGLLVAPIVVSQMMEGAVDLALEAVELELFDGDPLDAAKPLLQSYSQLSGLDSETPQQEAGKLARQTMRVIEVGSRLLYIRVSTTPAFEASLDRSNVALAGVGGVLASMLAALAVWLLASGRIRAQNLARRMTAELDTMARVVRMTDNAVVITDADLHITWVNDGFTRMSGYTLAEATGQKPGELLGTGKTPPETIFRLIQAAENGEPCRVEVLNRTKDGREYWLDTDVHPLRDAQGALVSFMEVGTDITAQKQAQLALETAQQRLTALTDRLNLAIEGGSDGLWDWMDLDSEVQWWSPSYYGLLGYNAHELPPSSSNFVNLVHPDDRDRLHEVMDGALRHGKPYDHEMRLHTKNRGYRWFRSRAKVFRDAQGNAIRMAGSASDVHDRKQAEAEVERASALLRGSIDALNDAFVLYDPQDKLVLCNRRHREIYPLVADVLVPGNSFEFVVRTAAQRGQYRDTGLEPEA
jgi:PAS domain S-box-containing protein